MYDKNCDLVTFRDEEAAKKQTRPISKAPEGEGCPRCGFYVYAAEQMLARGRVSFLLIHWIFVEITLKIQGFHRRCFKCVSCNRTLDSVTHCDGPDKQIYCKGWKQKLVFLLLINILELNKFMLIVSCIKCLILAMAQILF